MKRHVLLLFGGESSEHDVSLQSARNVYAALDDDKYDVTLCYIDKVGRWWLVDSVEGPYIGRPQLIPQLGQRVFGVVHTTRLIKPDVIFPVLHGVGGEDGSVQGLARLMHIACVGPSLLSAAVAMDKDITKRLVRDAGVPVVPWRTVSSYEVRPRASDVLQTLGNTVFVKPAGSGSSVGVHKVTNAHELGLALTDAFSHDSAVLVEKAIDAREIEVAVLGGGAEHAEVSGVGEVIPGEAFYSYNDKYAATSTARVVVPAELAEDVVETIRQYALRAYAAINGRGMARIDFFIDKQNGHIYLNEVNAIPGFTNISMYPKLWHEAGISYAALVDKLILLALP